MTIGIYSLYWEEQDLIYIGQSQSIERRFKDHIKKLTSRTHSNYKVQNAYNLYGTPLLTIIEECSISNLDTLEIFWTAEFNSLNTVNGLNIVEAGAFNTGTRNINSKYSKLQILLSFRALYNTKLTYKDIFILYGIKISNLNSIFSGKTHTWLKEKYPNSYLKMLNNKGHGTHSKRSGNNITLISPNGTEVMITISIKSFAKENNLHEGHLSEVIAGKRKHHKHWSISTNNGDVC